MDDESLELLKQIASLGKSAIITIGKKRHTICAVAKVDETNNRIICLTKKGIGLFKQKMNFEDILKVVSNAYIIPFNEILNVKAT